MGALSLEDYVALSGLVFDWADSYDSKDWAKLKSILAPELSVDYTALGGAKTEAMPAADFVAMVSGPKMFGEASLRTQHLVGASKLDVQSDHKAIGHHQVRSRSTRSEAGQEVVQNDRTIVVMQTYIRMDGVWKLAGLKPMAR